MKNKVFFSIIIILIIIIIEVKVFAIDFPSVTLGDSVATIASTDLGLGDLNNYKGGNVNSDTLKYKANNILGVIQKVGVVVSVVMLMAIGIKYMLGSVEEKAEYKSTLVPYVIGALILFTGATIPSIIYKIAQGI